MTVAPAATFTVATSARSPTRTALAFIATRQTTGDDRPRLGCRFAYDRATLDRLKATMPRGSFHESAKVWSWPLTPLSCRRLRAVFGDGLEVSPPLADWYRQRVAEDAEREQQRKLDLARKAREAEEQSRLDAERALYGEVHTAGPMAGIPTGSAVRPPEFLDLNRVPVAECPPLDLDQLGQWLALPERSKRLDIQLSGASWLAYNGGGVLADEVGLGKSLTILMALLGGPLPLGPHLIVAPLKVARATWPAEVAKWARPGAVDLPDWHPGLSGPGWNDRRARAVGQCLAAVDSPRRPIILVINHDAAHRYEEMLLQVPWASIVVDEADQALSIGWRARQPEPTGTKMARSLAKLRTQPDGARIALTGTPFRGRLANMWGLIDFVRPAAVGRARKDFAYLLTQPAGEEGGGVTLDRVKVGQEGAWLTVMGDWVLRRTRTAAQRALVERRIETVEPTEVQLAQDDDWRTCQMWSGLHADTEHYECVDRTDGGSLMRVRATGETLVDVIVAVTRRLQLSVGEMTWSPDRTAAEYSGPSPKVDKVMDLLAQWGLDEPDWWWMAGEHGKAIIASPWTTGLDLVEQRLRATLPTDCWVRLDGSTTPRRVSEVVDAFTAPRGPGIMLLSTQAGGAGLTLDQHCTRMIIMSEHWIADEQDQVVGRIANRTWDAPREVVTLRTAGMLDAYLGARTEHQERTQGAMLELARADVR